MVTLKCGYFLSKYGVIYNETVDRDGSGCGVNAAQVHCIAKSTLDAINKIKENHQLPSGVHITDINLIPPAIRNEDLTRLNQPELIIGYSEGVDFD